MVARGSSFPCARLALALAEFHKVAVSLFLQLAQVPLNGSPALECVHCSPQFGAICTCGRNAPPPLLQTTHKDVKLDTSQDRPLHSVPLVTAMQVERDPLTTTL